MFIGNEDIQPLKKKVLLASPTMHEEEMRYIKEAFEKNWITTAGDNVNELERISAEYIGCGYAVGLSSGTAALHMCMKLAGEKINPVARPEGALTGQKVFCTDMTFDATVNPVLYEGGCPVFIDTDDEDWNMSTEALKKAFEIYPDTRLVIVADLYGTPGKLEKLRKICREHGALLIEDAAESLGAKYNIDGKWQKAGTFGDYNAISFNGNKIITGSAGGMFLTDSEEDANKVRKWSTQAREAAPWYQHEELGFNYRISNIIAGIARGQFAHLGEHIAKKKEIYDRYRKGLEDLPVSMNPYDEKAVEPNFCLSCMLIHQEAMCRQVRSDREALYVPEHGKTCPTEILETMAKYNIEGRPIWKPMHMQPIYRNNGFVTTSGKGRAMTNAYISGKAEDVGMDIFARGLCLPSDIKMTKEEQDMVIDIIRRCFE